MSKGTELSKPFVAAVIVVAGLALYPSSASAHCDALDGPVVNAARAALEKGDVDLVLRWVPPEREADVRAAFSRTARVRTQGDDARELADTWFFETLVRIHRAGEGEPFEGLRPAGHIEGFVQAVDQSLVTGNGDAVVANVTSHVSERVRERFARARAAGVRADSSVAAGREYVAAYVDYLHYVEALLKAGEHGLGDHALSTNASIVPTPVKR
jgi:hypothetical protein